MSFQKQDLKVFSDNSIITSHFLKRDTHNMMLLTYKNGTEPTWLLVALLETLIRGSPMSINEVSSNQSVRSMIPKNMQASTTIVMSFIHDIDFFENIFKKSKLPRTSYEILDLCIDFVHDNAGKPIDKVLNSILLQVPEKNGSVIIIEQPELLMSLFSISSDILHRKFIGLLAKRCSLLIVVTNVEGFDNEAAGLAGSDTIEFTRFSVTAFNRSVVYFGLRPLDTGIAEDITGILEIRRAGMPFEGDVHVVETEYLFHLQKESIKLFYK